jgi:hypothetical protein
LTDNTGGKAMLGKAQYDLIGAIASISKANPAVITLVPAARPVDARCAVGVYVHVYAPGWTMFDGINAGTRLVNAVNAAAGTITIAADTTAQVDTTISPVAQVNMHN